MSKIELLKQADEEVKSQLFYGHTGGKNLAKLIKALADEVRRKKKRAIPKDTLKINNPHRYLPPKEV